MNKKDKNLSSIIIETGIWIGIILATIIAVTGFSWSTASSILQYILAGSSVFAMYFYLKNKRLFRESEQKTKEIIKKQKELKESHKTINLIFEQSADGIMILDQEKRIEAFSPGMEKISGYSKKEALGRLANQLLKFRSSTESSLLPDLMFTIPKTEKQAPYITNVIINKDGGEVEIEASYTLTTDPQSGSVKALAIIRDITYEKALAQRDKEFIAITSHQLNTPLSIIKGYTALLLNKKTGKISEKQLSYLKEIKSSTEKMVILVSDLLSISRIEQDKIKLNIEDVNLKDILQSVLYSLAEKAKQKKIKLNVRNFPENLIIMADPDKLHQALTNLVENAIKYTEKGAVEVEIRERKDDIDLIIKDSGIGISKQEIEKIGTRFFRTQEAINIDHHGTGLGVFITKTIIEKHHGQISVKSTPGKGTSVTINLPKKQLEEN